MRIPVTEAEGQLADLVRRAEAGEAVILTRDGCAVVELVPVWELPRRESRRAVLERARASGAVNASNGPSAARSQDFLYGEDGLPE